MKNGAYTDGGKMEKRCGMTQAAWNESNDITCTHETRSELRLSRAIVLSQPLLVPYPMHMTALLDNGVLVYITAVYMSHGLYHYKCRDRSAVCYVGLHVM